MSIYSLITYKFQSIFDETPLPMKLYPQQIKSKIAIKNNTIEMDVIQ